MAGSNRKQKTVRGTIASLGVTVMAAAVIYVFVPHDDHAPDIRPVDYSVELITARRAASYPVAAPEGLPAGWKATSVRYRADQGDFWHLGFQDPDGQYVAVEQSTQKRAAFIDDASQGGHATKMTQRIDGRTWTRWTGGRYDALVHEDGKGATTVVAGTAGFDGLTTMARALELKKTS
ncbi:DUF4245 domain-containing protein [Streptomyces similanensis]|uniref:DUF4245 domain-containing protein n=1 Tax=Streptomyces similanensis TaxID=1274988 RepID=A0ABP9L225_9ACTN